MAPHPSVRTALLVALLAAVPAAAQGATPTPDCGESLDFLAAKIAVNYSGFQDKVTDRTRPAHDALLAKLRDRARTASDDAGCLAVLREYTDFFQDGHLSVRPVATASASASAPTIADTTPAGIRAHFASWPSVRVSEADVRRAVDRRGRRADPLEGIWEERDGHYRLAIVPDTAASAAAGARDAFVAVVLRADGVWWMPGQVKARLRRTGPGRYAGTFYLRDHRGQPVEMTVERGVLRGWGMTYTREHPAPVAGMSAEAYYATLNLRTMLRRLSPRTMLLQLPSFAPHEAAVVDSLLRAHHAEITSTEHLIVDLRGNGGGSDFVYLPVLPYLYTDTVVTRSSSIYATDDNIAKFEFHASDTTLPARERERITALVERLRAVRGGWLRRDDSRYARDTVYALPRRVAVLVDGDCASSCEQFVLAARQSRKVTLYGENTDGVLDYANNWSLRTPDGRFQLNYPTSRSQRLPHDPVDPHGIVPDVRVPAGEVVWLEWVRKDLES